ncbi:MAG: hypothetical protein JRN52_07885 [Nitrososphaerota archaeon]|nr:hypothetical protein [Nitrososphaerota archaeon]
MSTILSGLDATTFKILDALLTEMGSPISINELTKKIGRSYGRAYYANIYRKIQSLTKEKITSLERVGNTSIASLNFENPITVDLLTEMDLRKKQGIFQRRPRLQILLTSIQESFADFGSIMSISLIDPEKNMKLNRAEFLILVRTPVHRKRVVHTTMTDEITDIYRTMKSLQSRFNIRIHHLALPSDEFLDLLRAREINPLREILGSPMTNFFSPQSFWFEIALASKEGIQIKLLKSETSPFEITEDELVYNLARFGYRELGPRIIKSADICIELIITSILLKGVARRIEAIPILLAKNEPNYNLLIFLSEKYGVSSKLLGLLKSLEKERISSTPRKEAITILESIGTKEEIGTKKIDMFEKLRLYSSGDFAE